LERRPGVIDNLLDHVYTTPSINPQAYETMNFAPYLRG
jgi:hypothetical protein